MKLVHRTNSVLVVEDNYDLLETITYALESAGFTVWKAANGVDALDQLRTTPIDTVLTDLELPEMNGLELARTIKQRHSNLRVILMSGRPDANESVAALAGADLFLAKPLVLSELTNYLKKAGNG